jgi:pSer/pThr/pTyr-binding forkhead associated (FHA) protein
MTDNNAVPDVQVETTSVFRADLLKEMENSAGSAPSTGNEVTPPAGAGMLVVKRGPNAGARFLLDQATTTAGRHPDSDIFLDDVTVSRRHAEFRVENDKFEVVDVGSLNGTYVNREPRNAETLNSGDEIQIGKFRLVFIQGSGN